MATDRQASGAMRWRRQCLLALPVLLLFLLAYGWHRRFHPQEVSIPVRCEAAMTRTNMAAGPYYLQKDPAWGNDRIGGSGEPLSAAGCTVCCVSMAFAELGIPLDPKQLNAALNRCGGYTSQGLLEWEVAASLTTNAVVFDIPARPSHAAIGDALGAGQPVLAKILLWRSVPHWVLIVGQEGNDYLVKNPLCTEPRIQRLSELTERIESIRIARRRVGGRGVSGGR